MPESTIEPEALKDSIADYLAMFYVEVQAGKVSNQQIDELFNELKYWINKIDTI